MYKNESDKTAELLANLVEQGKIKDGIIITREKAIKLLESDSDSFRGIVMNNQLIEDGLREMIKEQGKEVKKLKIKNGFLGVGLVAVSIVAVLGLLN